ncbi:MAG: hypothetical protein KKA73_26435 [Chloroflexi bacterium]|nr:hypothetical protein [Chloroflexota bacterium]MBU1751238.1 hypothetical protein [Chloroflexota bacterium]
MTARRIVRDLGLPMLAQDDFKEILFDSLGWSDQVWSRRLHRFQQRTTSGERHPGHVDEGNLDEFRDALRRAPWGTLDIAGRVVYVDTKDFATLDYDQVMSAIQGTGPSPS